MLNKARLMGLRALAIEAAPSVGGTWYHNRYPGARVDVQSLEYSLSRRLLTRRVRLCQVRVLGEERYFVAVG
jgi:cation diffusion facilitator CzcD-associated flavoprotein CzcO